MLQANPTSSAFASSFAPTAPYGRPKRGTPDYANAVRRQIARLAAMHAASVAEMPPAPPAPVKTVLLVAACPRVRDTVRSSLTGKSSVRFIEVTSVEEAREQLAIEEPHLMLVDQPQSAALSLSTGTPAVLIASAIPRSADLPRELAGVLASPLNTTRVSRQVLSILERDD